MTESKGGDNSPEVVEEILNKQKLVNELLVRANKSNEVTDTRRGRERIFHDIFIIGKVEKWCSTSCDGEHMGWGIYPLNSTVYSSEEITFTQVECVSFDDVKNITPQSGDIAHVRRAGSWIGIRLSIGIIKGQ